jgi:hypothetical protein
MMTETIITAPQVTLRRLYPGRRLEVITYKYISLCMLYLVVLFIRILFNGLLKHWILWNHLLMYKNIYNS